jgi:hypothetical protein
MTRPPFTPTRSSHATPRDTTTPPCRPATRGAAVALVLAGLLLPVVPAQAKPFQEAKGWYTIEVPEGFQPKKSADLQMKFEVKGGDGWFLLQVVPANNDLDLLTVIPLTFFKKIMPNATADGEPQNFTIDGRPARWLVYRGTMVTGDRTTPFAALGGAIALPAGGVVLMSGMEPPALAKYGEAITAAFRTLRAGPAAAAGAGGTPAPGAAESPKAAPAASVLYQDPNGRFAIDLPPGFVVKSADESSARFDNAAGAGWFQLTTVTASNDLEVVSSTTRKVFDKLLPNAKIDGGPKDFMVDGRPARWTVYRGTMTAGGITQLTVGLGGSLSLPKCGVMLVAALPPGTYDQCGDAIAASFKTLRAGGGVKVPGAAIPTAPAPAAAGGTAPAAGTVTKEAFGATSTVNADGSTTFRHPAGSFDLPPGWRVGKPEGQLAFAQFTGPGGGTLSFLIGPRGYRSNKAMCQGAEAQIHSGAPQLQIQPQGHYEVDSQRGNKVTLARYKGPFPVSGREIEGLGFTAWGKADRGLIVGVGIAIGEKAAAEIDDMEKIARTLR